VRDENSCWYHKKILFLNSFLSNYFSLTYIGGLFELNIEIFTMSKIFTLCLALAAVTIIHAQQYQPVDEKSEIKFEIKNFGINTGGNFKGLQGTIAFDASNPAAASFDMSIDANTVNTDNGSRDGHLRKEEYFDVKNYPRISFKSAKITSDKSSFQVFGKLTIKGVTKDISFPFKATRKDDGYLFEGTYQIDRRDFKVGGSSLVMGDNVKVTLSVYAKKK
jgi:polyisoprenoid-binding protein YceI